MFGIKDIMAVVSKNYFVRPTFYQVAIIGGNGAIVDATQDMMFYCCAVNVPGITMETAEENRYKIGNPRHYPKQKTYTELTLTFYEAEFLQARAYFTRWMDSIQNTTDFRMAFYEDIIKTIIISQFDKTGTLVTYQATMLEAYPVEVGALERGYDKVNTIPTFTVGFKFHVLNEVFTQQPPLTGINAVLNNITAVQNGLNATGITTLSSLTNLISGK